MCNIGSKRSGFIGFASKKPCFSLLKNSVVKKMRFFICVTSIQLCNIGTD